MKKTVIYARYSCDGQSEQSIEGQLRVCEDYAKRNGMVIVGKYIDRAMTGKNDKRPDFQRMINDSKEKEWECILVYRLDRFSRNKYESVMYKHMLKQNGVKIVSAMENIPDTPEGIILESLLEAMNQYYSAELALKVKRGLKESWMKGNFTGGIKPFGYKLRGKKLIINPVEAEIVKECFNRYSWGESDFTIINSINQRGRLYRGKFLNSSTFYKMIKNKKYVGIFEYEGVTYKKLYPAIISEDLFNRVAKIREYNRHGHCSRKTVFYLRQKMYCGYCNSIMRAESGTSEGGKLVKYYKCPNKHYYDGCIKESYVREIMESAVEEMLEKIINTPIVFSRLKEYALLNSNIECNEDVSEFYDKAINFHLYTKIRYFIKKIVAYNDKIDVYFNSPLKSYENDNCKRFFKCNYNKTQGNRLKKKRLDFYCYV